ncbi:hypothetical protein TrST_g11867 [Triparma strigata]|uniref:Uncharacterized protein n=1 Tax=Triparma strigata TaxID=1606541 RepID=A0A9W7EL60_9STRA|nr:hypothetical protein TrST_g11867 [Triparma strigata]
MPALTSTIDSLSTSLSEEIAKDLRDTVEELCNGVWGDDGFGYTEKEKCRAIKKLAKEVQSALQHEKDKADVQKRGNEKKILKLREDRSKALAALQQLEVKLDIEDLPLLKRKKALEAELKKLEELKRERLSAAKPLLDKYNTIKTNLLELVKGSGDEGGASYPDLVVDNYLGAGGASALTELVDAREKELADKKKVEESLQQENKKLEAELDAKPEDFDPPPSSARVKYEILKALKKSRMDDLKKLGEAIGKLWSELGVGNEERAEFTARVKATGMRPESKKVGEEEVKRLRGLKAEKQSSQLKLTRDEISKNWDLCGYSEDQRSKFVEYKQDASEDEHLLAKHETYLDTLTTEFETKKPVLLLIQKYNSLSKSRRDLFERENAGSGAGMAAKLGERRNSAQMALETSKLTAAVSKDLPRVLQKLVQAVKASEATPITLADGRQVRRPFMFKGERFLAMLDRKEKEFKKLKEEFRQDREKRKIERRASGSGIVNPNPVAMGADSKTPMRMNVAASVANKLRLAGGRAKARRATVNAHGRGGSPGVNAVERTSPLKTPPSRRSTVAVKDSGGKVGGSKLMKEI